MKEEEVREEVDLLDLASWAGNTIYFRGPRAPSPELGE